MEIDLTIIGMRVDIFVPCEPHDLSMTLRVQHIQTDGLLRYNEAFYFKNATTVSSKIENEELNCRLGREWLTLT